MAIVEENFPRGGKSKNEKRQRTANEKKRKVENLFKNATGKKINKRRLAHKKRQSNRKKEKKDFESLTSKEKKVIEKEKTMLESIEPFSFKMLAEGMQLLSRIQEVRELDVLLNLPGRIQAVVPITNISTPYSNLLNRLAQNEEIEAKELKGILVEGEIFPCSIKEVTNDGSFKVTASLNPVDVNSDIPATSLCKGMKMTAAVQSIEDHGYVMDVGILNVRSFLTKIPDQDLAIGQIVSVCVVECKIDGHIATLTLSTVETIKFKQNVEVNLSTLLPATKVHVTVNKVLPEGLTVTFGNLVGYIHRDHLVNINDKSSAYEKGSNYTAVVLYTLPLVNAVYLSLKSSLINPVLKRDEIDPICLGQFFEGTITGSTSAGLFMQLNEKARGFVPLRHLSDKPDIFEDMRVMFPIKSQKRCRILSYASLDDIYICTLKKSLLTQKAIRYEDFTVGEVLEAKVNSVKPAGVSVDLGVNLQGFIPKLHWADDPRLKKPELRFRVGESITCRVLKVMIDRKTIHLTCKKSMLDEAVVPYSHHSQLEKQLALKGTVAFIDESGVLVSFFDELTGYIPKNRLLKKGITDINRYFYIGQVIDCTVDDIHENGKVTLTLGKPDSAQSESRAAESAKIFGSIVKCKVERIVDGNEGGIIGLEVSIPPSDSSGFIPMEHLSDFSKVAPQLLHCYRPGQIIEEAVIWAYSGMQTVLTIKPSIVDFVKEDRYPKSINEFDTSSFLPCVALRHRSFGVFASLLCPPNKYDVLFPMHHMSPELYSSLEKDTMHVSLEGRIIRIDKEKQKLSLSAFRPDNQKNAVQVLTAFLMDQEKIKDHFMESSDEGLKSLASLKRGNVVVGKLLTEFDSSADLEFELPHGIKGIVPIYHHANKAFKKNDLIVGSVLYVDLIMKKVYVTTRDEVINAIKGSSKLDPKGKIENERNGKKGQIILNTDYFSLVSFTMGKKKHFAFTSNIRSINEFSAPPAPPFEVGAEVTVVVDSKTKFGKIATYQKTQNNLASHLVRKKRAYSSEDGPDKKMAKKEIVAETNSKSYDNAVDEDKTPASTESKLQEDENKEAQQEQLTELNNSEEAEKPIDLEINKSLDKKKTKPKKNKDVAEKQGTNSEENSTKKTAPLAVKKGTKKTAEMRAYSLEKGQDKKKTTKEIVTETNTKSHDNAVDKDKSSASTETNPQEGKNKEAQQEQLSELNNAEEVEKPIALEINKSLDNKKTKTKKNKNVVETQDPNLEKNSTKNTAPLVVKKGTKKTAEMHAYSLEEGRDKKKAKKEIVTETNSKSHDSAVDEDKNSASTESNPQEGENKEAQQEQLTELNNTEEVEIPIALEINKSLDKKKTKTKKNKNVAEMQDPNLEKNSTKKTAPLAVKKGTKKTAEMRAYSLEDGRDKKNATNEIVTETNTKSHDNPVDKDKNSASTESNPQEGENKEAQQEQLTELNNTEEAEKPIALEIDKSLDKKKTKAKKNKNVAETQDPNSEENSTKNTAPLAVKKKTKKATEIKPGAQEENVSIENETVSKGKRSASEDKITAHLEKQKDLSPSKKRRVEATTPSVVNQNKKINPLELPRLSITSAFKWDDGMTSLPLSTSQIVDSSDSEDDDAEKEKVVVKDRRERAREKLEEAKIDEAKLSQIEEELNNPERAPATTDDFDRMVLASPNSSILWVQYMAFHLENAEIEKARTVAQRALKIMSFREEQEKFNVWIAWLNLEHMYGTSEGYESTFQEAIRYNEPFKVYRQMALNFEQSGKFDEAESLYTTMLKKYKQNKSVWMNACVFYVRNSKLDTARGVFQRALSILDKKEHIDLISRFAQLEIKFGQKNRGKTLFDTLMMSYPKRTDLWLVYIDTLTKVDDIESARQVLERCITLQLSAKKMKTIFQKYLEFETHHGDEEKQDYVRKKALEYVESKTEAVDE